MNKRILRFSLIIVLVASLCAGFFGTVTVSADNDPQYKVVIDDGAGLLTSSQKEKLREEMLRSAEYANVAFVTTNDNPYYSGYAAAEKAAQQYAEAYFMRTFGNGTNGVVFLIDMEARVIWIASAGEAYTHVTDGRATSITDNAYNYASNKDYYGCAMEVFREIRTILSGGVIPEPMKIASNVLLAIAASMLVMFFIVQGVMNPKKATAGELKAASFVTFEGSQPIVYHTGQTRRYDPPAKSSGGGGGWS